MSDAGHDHEHGHDGHGGGHHDGPPRLGLFRRTVRGGLRVANRGIRGLASLTHRAQFIVEWKKAPYPEWFDHHLDQFYQWRTTQNPMPWERGFFNLLAIKPGGTVLEMCCGDGFNAYHFYAGLASKVTAVDFDPDAVKTAQRNFGRAGRRNIEFAFADIRQGLPGGPYDNILWDAAIEHFKEAEIDAVLSKAKALLRADGILSGYTIIEKPDGGESHHEHEREFKSKQDLLEILRRQFPHVVVLQTNRPDRQNLYFFAAVHDNLPFLPGWTGTPFVSIATTQEVEIATTAGRPS